MKPIPVQIIRRDTKFVVKFDNEIVLENTTHKEAVNLTFELSKKPNVQCIP